jgi:Tfp pilus assembly protein FimT
MDLKATRDNIANQMQLARAKAIATGVDQPIHFNASFGYDYHLHPAGATSIQGWNLPQGVSYEWPSGSPLQVTMRKDGSASWSFMVPLANARGQRDTVMVLASGMVISQ